MVDMETSALSDSEEEIIVYAEIKENVNIGKQRNIHILGIDDKHPIIQMGDSFLRGTFQSPLGTYMFFEEDSEPKSEDSLFDKLPDKNLKYFMKTGKYLHLEHAHIMPREKCDQDSQKEHQQPAEIIEPVHFESVQEALDKLKTDWLPEIAQEISSSSNQL